MDVVAFKKRAKKSSSSSASGVAAPRKRTRLDNDEESTHDSSATRDEHEQRAGKAEDEDPLQTIEELREDQRLRAQLLRSEQRKAKKHASAAGSATGQAAAASDAQYGLHDPKKDGAAGQKLLNLLDGQFTGQSGVTQRDQYEELANKYIEERLQKRAVTDDDAHATDVAETSSVPNDEDALYAELRKDVGGPQAASESAHGGVLVWNTGIAEVELPSAYHEKTIRETAKALERERVAAQTKIQSSALPTNFSTDFNRHKTEFISELKALPREEQRDRGFVAAPSKHKPSDDQAVSRFRKMESRRRHN